MADRKPGWAWLNGVSCAVSEARISPLDFGFLYGDGLFETMRAYGRKIFRLEAHMTRLDDGMRTLEIRGAPAVDDVARWVEETLERSELEEAVCRVTVTRGLGLGGFDPAACDEPTVFVTAMPLEELARARYEDGVEATILWPRALGDMPPPNVKSTSYQRSVLGKLELGRRGCAEGFFLDEHGSVTEGTTSNVFVAKDGRLSTPPAAVCLAGITRAEVLAIAVERNIPVRETPLTREELVSADEVFVTNSRVELLPIVTIDGVRIGSGKPGAVTQAIHAAYRARASTRTVARQR